MQEELEDITTCCICSEVFTDPKALPCIHTFCMKCIQDTGNTTNKGSGDEMPCPICRRLFRIPQDGFSGLPKHFFIERLIQASKISDTSAETKTFCTLCLEESKEQKANTPTADTYCAECKHNLCDQCCIEHRQFKLTKKHKLIPVDEQRGHQNLVARLGPIVCEVHEQKVLDVYCANCKTVVCAICFIEQHKSHEGSHVSKCVDGFRKQIKDNTENMNGCITQAQKKQAELVKKKEQMKELVRRLEHDIDGRKQQIKQFAENHASSLLQGLRYKRQSRLKEIQKTTDDITAYLSNLESYNSYCRRLIDKGTVSDLCLAISDLSVRAMELQQQCQPIMQLEVRDFEFYFRQSELKELPEEDCDNLIGEIEEKGDLKKTKSKILLAVQNKEIEMLKRHIAELKKEFDAEKTICNSLRTSKDKEKADYMAHIEELKEELENHKIANHALKVSRDNLKLELNAEKTISSSLRTVTDKLFEELETCKVTKETEESNAEKLTKSPDTYECRYKLDPVIVQTIVTRASAERKKDIRGMTIIEKELFVVSANSSEVEIYDSLRFSLSRRWNFRELNDPRALTSCVRNKCLYILNSSQSQEILRIDAKRKSMRKWSTGKDCGCALSVTDESNVILTVNNESKLNEYSPEGQLLSEINLLSESGGCWPSSALKLANGHFVICHGRTSDDVHRVCMVDVDGRLKKSFGGNCGYAIGQMNVPVDLCVDGNEFLMVADYFNSRVLLLNSDLQFEREIISHRFKHGLRYPERILLDESNGRLFVADNEIKNPRILVFKVI